MDNSTFLEYRASLRSWADDLGREYQVPVLVQAICERLGIGLSRSSAVGRRKAYLSLDPSKDSAGILLPERKAESSFERFCVAHELAHYFLYRNFGAIPECKSEYWDHELICDDFARHLLVPTVHLSKALSNCGSSAEHYLNFCSELALSARVPWIQAAIRISEINSEVYFMRCSPDEGGSMRLQSTSLPSAKGRLSKLGDDTDLARSFDHLIKAAHVSRMTINADVRGQLLACKKVMSIFELKNVEIECHALAEPDLYPDVKVAIKVKNRESNNLETAA